MIFFWIRRTCFGNRSPWLQGGDRNTKFFHISTLLRRRRNKIERLKTSDGIWVNDKEAINNLAVSLLFIEESVNGNICSLPGGFPSLGSSKIIALGRPVLMEEVKASLFGLVLCGNKFFLKSPRYFALLILVLVLPIR